jgi:dihydropteroate synthase
LGVCYNPRTMRPRFQWNLGRRSLALGERTLVMGVLNVTPDSFSDGGRYLDPRAAIDHGHELLDEGADILDIGGESTRPGTPIASPSSSNIASSIGTSGGGGVSAEQELDRVLPVLEGLHRERPDAILSIDTYKSKVARAALDAGAEIVNDVSGLTWDAAMAATVAERSCGLVLMHTRGLPAEWAMLPPLPDPAPLVLRELAARADAALEAGIARDSIVLDPGFGFGKRDEENYALLARLPELHSLGFPVLAALSRKGFLGRTIAARLAQRTPTGSPSAELARPETSLSDPLHARDIATLAATVAAALAGAHIVRVHAVAPAVEALAIADAILQAKC